MGFTARVMARIEERERAQARRQAMLGAGLLVVAASALLAFSGVALASLLAVLAASPDTTIRMIMTLSPSAFALLEAMWVALAAIVRRADSAPMLVYALGVFALTLVWARVVMGLPSPRTISVGGST
jgi:hypothetical protein